MDGVHQLEYSTSFEVEIDASMAELRETNQSQREEREEDEEEGGREDEGPGENPTFEYLETLGTYPVSRYIAYT